MPSEWSTVCSSPLSHSLIPDCSQRGHLQSLRPLAEACPLRRGGRGRAGGGPGPGSRAGRGGGRRWRGGIGGGGRVRRWRRRCPRAGAGLRARGRFTPGAGSLPGPVHSRGRFTRQLHSPVGLARPKSGRARGPRASVGSSGRVGPRAPDSLCLACEHRTRPPFPPPRACFAGVKSGVNRA
jgi:hypothetical protein